MKLIVPLIPIWPLFVGIKHLKSMYAYRHPIFFPFLAELFRIPSIRKNLPFYLLIAFRAIAISLATYNTIISAKYDPRT
jgi:hypothetical protein